MEQYEYKYLSNAFSVSRVLRQVEKYEQEGWSLYCLQPGFLFVFGSGGPAGMTAIMRRSRLRETNAAEKT